MNITEDEGKYFISNSQIYDVSSSIQFSPSRVIVEAENLDSFIFRTKEKDYVLDFQKILKDYGIEVKENE